MTNKSSQEIMNGCGKKFNNYQKCGDDISITKPYKRKDLIIYCDKCQAQRQERLECYKKWINSLELLYSNLCIKYCDNFGRYENKEIEGIISQLKKEIKILEGK